MPKLLTISKCLQLEWQQSRFVASQCKECFNIKMPPGKVPPGQLPPGNFPRRKDTCLKIAPRKTVLSPGKLRS